MKVAEIDITTWEVAADDRGHWRAVAKTVMERAEENRYVHEAGKREKSKQKSSLLHTLQRPIAGQAYTVTCPCATCSNGPLPFKLTL